MTRSRVWLAALSAAVAIVVWSAAPAARAAVGPGITGGSIVLGATAPLSGPSASFAAVVRGAEAYFAHVNSQGGVYGRRILYRVLDDGGDPTRTPAATRRLVTRERVFAVVGSFGAEQSLAVRAYLNATRVPQLFVVSGAVAFGADSRSYPYTIGFQPTFAAEGRVLGGFLARTKPKAKVAVLAQEDILGRELLGGFRRGLAGTRARIVAVERSSAAATDVRAQIEGLAASGGDTLALFATPAFATRVYALLHKLSWRPAVLTNAAASSPAVMGRASKGGRSRLVTGAVSAAFLKDPTDPAWRTDPGMRLYRAIMAAHAPGRNPRDLQHVYGMAVAHTVVEALRRAGPNVTRAALLDEVRALRVPGNPFLLPGIEIRTSARDAYPVEQLQLRFWERGRWRAFGGLWGRRAE